MDARLRGHDEEKEERMFRRKKDRTVTWPVEVYVPVDGGQFETQTFNARFLLLEEDPTIAELGNLDRLSAAVVGWDSVTDDDGSDFAYSPEARELLLRIGYVRTALFRAYIEASLGAKRKN